MDCFVCAKKGSEQVAVAVCPRCSAGLCLEHVNATLGEHRSGLAHQSCGHIRWNPSDARQLHR